MFVGDSLASCLAIYAWHSADCCAAGWCWLNHFSVLVGCIYEITILSNVIFQTTFACIHAFASSWWTRSFFFQLKTGSKVFGLGKWGGWSWAWDFGDGDWWLVNLGVQVPWIPPSECQNHMQRVVQCCAFGRQWPMSLGSLKFAAMLSGIGKLSTLAGRNWSRRTYEP